MVHNVVNQYTKIGIRMDIIRNDQKNIIVVSHTWHNQVLHLHKILHHANEHGSQVDIGGKFSSFLYGCLMHL